MAHLPNSSVAEILDCEGRWVSAVERECDTVTQQVSPSLCYILDAQSRQIVGARVLLPRNSLPAAELAQTEALTALSHNNHLLQGILPQHSDDPEFDFCIRLNDAAIRSLKSTITLVHKTNTLE